MLGWTALAVLVFLMATGVGITQRGRRGAFAVRRAGEAPSGTRTRTILLAVCTIVMIIGSWGLSVGPWWS